MKSLYVKAFLNQYISTYFIVLISNVCFLLFGFVYIRYLYERISLFGIEGMGVKEFFCLGVLLFLMFTVFFTIIIFTRVIGNIVRENYTVYRARCQQAKGDMRLFNNGRWYKMKSLKEKKKVEPGTECDIVIVMDKDKKAVWDVVTNLNPIDIIDEFYVPDPKPDKNKLFNQ